MRFESLNSRMRNGCWPIYQKGEKMAEVQWKEVRQTVFDFRSNKEFVGVFLTTVPGFKNNDDFLFKDSQDNEVRIYGSAALSSKLKSIKAGTLCKIVYLGKKTNKSGLQSYHEYQVFTGDVQK